jgi:excisionase family DNA binding protein
MEEEIIPPLEDMPQAKLLITINEAAGLLNIRRTLFYRLMREGEILTIKVGRTRRVPVMSLREYVLRQLADARKGA